MRHRNLRPFLNIHLGHCQKTSRGRMTGSKTSTSTGKTQSKWTQRRAYQQFHTASILQGPSRREQYRAWRRQRRRLKTSLHHGGGATVRIINISTTAGRFETQS